MTKFISDRFLSLIDSYDLSVIKQYLQHGLSMADSYQLINLKYFSIFVIFSNVAIYMPNYFESNCYIYNNYL